MDSPRYSGVVIASVMFYAGKKKKRMFDEGVLCIDGVEHGFWTPCNTSTGSISSETTPHHLRLSRDPDTSARCDAQGLERAGDFTATVREQCLEYPTLDVWVGMHSALVPVADCVTVMGDGTYGPS